MAQVPLRNVPAGKRVRIHGVNAEEGMRGRLCALGLTPGTELDVCSQGSGCCVRVRDTSVILCDQMAALLICEPLDDRPAATP